MMTKRMKTLYGKVKQAVPILQAYMDSRCTAQRNYKDYCILKLAGEIQQTLRLMRDYIPEPFGVDTLIKGFYIDDRTMYRPESYIDQAFSVFESLEYYIDEKDNEYAMRYLFMTCYDLDMFITFYIDLFCNDEEEDVKKEDIREWPSF